MKYLHSAISFFQKLRDRIKPFLSLQKRPIHLFKVEYVNDIPDIPKPYVLYVLGKPHYEWLAGLSCPCGCGDLIELILDGRHPKWVLSFSQRGLPSLHPSIFRSVKCRSHFFLTNGVIIWCH